MSKTNLKLWNSVCMTDPKYTKPIKIGQRSFTAVNAQFQAKMATEQWGPMGDKWGLKNSNYQFIETKDIEGNDQLLCLYTAEFHSPEGSFDISSSTKVSGTSPDYKTKQAKFRIDEDFAKKLMTDAMTKALSKLGFSADIFLGMYDDNKYVENIKIEFEKAANPLTEEQFEKTKNASHSQIKLVLDGFHMKDDQRKDLEKIMFEKLSNLNENPEGLKKQTQESPVDFNKSKSTEQTTKEKDSSQKMEVIQDENSTVPDENPNLTKQDLLDIKVSADAQKLAIKHGFDLGPLKASKGRISSKDVAEFCFPEQAADLNEESSNVNEEPDLGDKAEGAMQPNDNFLDEELPEEKLPAEEVLDVKTIEDFQNEILEFMDPKELYSSIKSISDEFSSKFGHDESVKFKEFCRNHYSRLKESMIQN